MSKKLDEVYSIISDYSKGLSVSMTKLHDNVKDLSRIGVLSTMHEFGINLDSEETQRIITEITSDTLIFITEHELDVAQVYKYCKLRSRAYLIPKSSSMKPGEELFTDDRTPQRELTIRNMRIMIDDKLIRFTKRQHVLILIMVEYPIIAFNLRSVFNENEWMQLWLKSLSIRKELITIPNIAIHDKSTIRKLAVYTLLEQFDTALPVLAMELGLSGFLKLTDVIGGRKISIPSREKLEDLLRNAHETEHEFIVQKSSLTMASYYEKFMDNLSERYNKIAETALRYAKDCDVRTVISLLAELRKELELGMSIIQLSLKMFSGKKP